MKVQLIKTKIVYSIVYGIISLLVALVLIALAGLTYKTITDREKMSPFECGFDPSGVTRLPFCIKFFIVSVIFLVFDIEVGLILPMLISGLLVSTFLAVLVLGTIYE